MNDLFIQGLTIDWNRVRPYNYVRQIPAISGIDTFTFHKPITFFVGENGSGKSTLLEAIAVAYGFNAEGGTKNYSFSTYNSHSELCEAMTISKGYRRPKFGYFLRAESFYNVATKEIDYSDDDHPSKGYTKNHTVKVSSPLRRTTWMQMESIFLTSRKLRYPRRGSSRY